MKSLPKSYQNTGINENNSLSGYKGKLTRENIVKCNIKLKQTFPSLPPGFYDIFSERLKANNFTDERLIDAINHVIDNCIYPIPTIANFISFDKKVRLYNHNDIIEMLNDNPSAFKQFRPIKFENSSFPVYANIIDIEKYNLELAEKKYKK